MTAAEIQARLGTIPAAIRFSISERMVAEFAALTGDQSALHVSGAFARRSAYRQAVVHGMLPVALLALVDGLRIDGLVAVPVAIRGRFAGAVHAGDVLELSVAPARDQSSEGAVDFDFRIVNAASGVEVTDGSITLSYRKGPPDRAPLNRGNATACLLAGPVQALNLGLEDVVKGRSDGFEFVVSEPAVARFLEILVEGVVDKESARRLADRGDFHYPNLLGVALMSTLVGMRLPGNLATFLEFSAELERDIQQGELLRLEGVVTHTSRATRILRTTVTVLSNGDSGSGARLRGKVAALVNQAPRLMPAIGEIKASAMDMGLAGKVVLITGASRGIGETTAKLLALHGARVIVNYYRGRDDAERIVQEIQSAGGIALAIQADVTRLEQVRAMIDETRHRYGAVQVLVNNAVRDYRPIPFLRLSWDEAQADLDVIAKGAFNCCREVIPAMIESGEGKIINISSVAVDNPPPEQMKYVLAKSALVGLTRALAAEFAARNIQVNMVVPSFVETDLVSHIGEGFRSKIAQDTPMQRHASPIDVAKAVLFLASSHASFTTGQKIMVTGGGAPYL